MGKEVVEPTGRRGRRKPIDEAYLATLGSREWRARGGIEAMVATWRHRGSGGGVEASRQWRRRWEGIEAMVAMGSQQHRQGADWIRQ